MSDVITTVSIAQAPAPIRKVCEDWNGKARRAGEIGYRVSVSAITRPGGHVNHHLRLDLPNGQRLVVSLGNVEPTTIRSAIRALLTKSGQTVHFEF